ncbi:uncharacterized protein LOC126888366 isoform X4 [Diabrotica virgifera virgifera]|uniref:Uncharacterized protein n=1 Tax=Diabrotica virgifera virgifera TaxID=50390 RepID=A0ABM5KQP5_DIAVI|nr:uncharacterized protein LOC126888366 isoform X4 [Diabrotica virgifera virgifera]
MVGCALRSCSNHFLRKKIGTTFHSFPKDVQLRKAWIQFVNKERENWEPSKCSKLCTKHFAEKDIDRTSLAQPIRLRENAIPTIAGIPLGNRLNRHRHQQTYDIDITSVAGYVWLCKPVSPVNDNDGGDDVIDNDGGDVVIDNDFYLDENDVDEVPSQDTGQNIQKEAEGVERHHVAQKSEIINVSKMTTETVLLSENKSLLQKRLEESKVLQVEKEREKRQSTDQIKCDNTTITQKNEASNKENISNRFIITKEQLEQKCRTCFVRSGTNNVWIKYHDGMIFRDILKNFSLVEIHRSDGLPQSICYVCTNYIINLCTFKMNIDRSLKNLQAAFRQLENIPESQREEIDKSKVPTPPSALRQLDVNVPESQCEQSASRISTAPNVYKVVENLQVQVFESDEENDSQNDITQQIIIAPDPNKSDRVNPQYVNKLIKQTETNIENTKENSNNIPTNTWRRKRIRDNKERALKRLEKHLSKVPSAEDYRCHYKVRSQLKKYLRRRKLMIQKLKPTTTSVLLDHDYIKIVDQKDLNTHKHRRKKRLNLNRRKKCRKERMNLNRHKKCGEEKQKEMLCPCCIKGENFRRNKFVNRQICFDKYSHCDKYTCTYCLSKNSLWLKDRAHNRSKSRNKL